MEKPFDLASEEVRQWAGARPTPPASRLAHVSGAFLETTEDTATGTGAVTLSVTDDEGE